MRKGELSLQVVVIAAICLLVLVILTIVFSTKMAGWNKGLKNCDTVCKSTREECIDAGYDEIAVYLDSCEDKQGGKFNTHAYCCQITKSEEPAN